MSRLYDDDYRKCGDCRDRSQNSNDGGLLLCYMHEAQLKGNQEAITKPVVVLNKRGLFDEVTHFETTEYGLERFIEQIIDDYTEYADEKDSSKYAYSLGARIEHMTASELKAIPEV